MHVLCRFCWSDAPESTNRRCSCVPGVWSIATATYCCPPSCAETRLSVRRKRCQLCHLPRLHWVESQLALSRLGVSDALCRIHRDQHPSSKTHAANPRGPFRRQGYGVRFNGLPKLALIILSSTYLDTNRAWRHGMGVAIISPHPSPCWLGWADSAKDTLPTYGESQIGYRLRTIQLGGAR